MTNSISNDGILTRQPPAAPKKARHEGTEQADDRGTSTRTAAQGTDVGRAQQRLTQEVDRTEPSPPNSAAQAQALAQAVNKQVTANPQAALSAMGLVSETLFEAATARPTA